MYSNKRKQSASGKSPNEKQLGDKNTGEQMRCPLCNGHWRLVSVSTGAKLVAVSPQTIYRYIDQGLVYGLKVAGKTYRVCKQCLLREHLDS